jgi:signal transduction histidine kinase/CHASE3 domain sensor protein/ActR/RegA family two-component response regulator
MVRPQNTRREIIPALLFAAVPLLFIAGVVVFQLAINVPNDRVARADTVLSFNTIRGANAIDQAVQDAERGQRGFLITGRESYLEPYTSGKERLPQLMIDLQQATSGSPDQQQRLLKLQADVTTKMNELASTITAMRQQGYQAAKALVDTDLGRLSMEAVSTDLAAIMDAAEARLRTRIERADDAEERITETFVIASIAAVIALAAGAFLLARAYRRAAVSERMLQATLDSVREGVAAVDGLGGLRAWNSTFLSILGVAKDDVVRGAPLPLGELGSNKLAARFRELEAEARTTGRPVLVEDEGERGASIEIFHNPTADGGHVTTLLDVTERRKADEALRQAQKLESMGRMTGGVAHDFNNLLTIIIGSLGLLRRAVGRDDQARERIDMMSVAAERASRLTKQLLAFARRQPLEPEIVNLDHIMHEVLPLVRRAVGESITVECVTTGGLWNTVVDASEFQSAVLNLSINSRDAMPEGGKLTIEMANAALDDAYAARHAEVEPGQYVLVAVTDTGKGMDTVTIARALDPFFTTKPAGEGTGLGLPQVYGFVKQSGGHLKIYSEVGEGTSVKLYLPRTFGQETIQPAHAGTLALTGSETVLLVDDDEIVRTTVESMLEDLGYTVVGAQSGAEALTVLERGVKVDLLLTDVVMPGAVSGRQLAERAVKIVPSLKILFTSGYTENAIVHNGRLDPGVELLSKPYGREQLAAKVRRVLDNAPKAPRQAAGG